MTADRKLYEAHTKAQELQKIVLELYDYPELKELVPPLHDYAERVNIVVDRLADKVKE